MGAFHMYPSDEEIPEGSYEPSGTSLHGRPVTTVSKVSRVYRWDTDAHSRYLAGREWHLVQAANAGDANALEYLFTRNRNKLCTIAFSVLRNKEDAEEAVQEGLCKAWVSLRTFQGRSSFSSWLTRVVINKALMARRRKAVRPGESLDTILDNHPESLPRELVDAKPDPEKECAASEIRTLIDEQLQQLSPLLQAAYYIHTIEGHTLAESSQALGIRTTAVKSRISRARSKLARGLQGSFESAFGKSPNRRTNMSSHVGNSDHRR